MYDCDVATGRYGKLLTSQYYFCWQIIDKSILLLLSIGIYEPKFLQRIAN